MKKTSLESWLFRKMDYEGTPEGAKKYIEAYQLEKLRETIQLAQQNSIFYRKHLSKVSLKSMDSFEDFQSIPFTTAGDLQENPLNFLCVSQDEIQRIVTLNTSGTSGASKRIYFTQNDQKLIVDFFAVGMSNLVKGGDRVLILLPGQQPGSVGDLLKKALEGIHVKAYIYGFVDDPERIFTLIEEKKINCLVGLPVQVLMLARCRNKLSTMRKCLLTADYVPEVTKKVLQENWRCKVFTHYGMTEMGLGGGVECEALDGYHLREADLYFEVIDPYTGKVVADGEWGEVVFTTLTREGMPLIRYRTGDIARFIQEPCPCGSILKRLDKVMGRWDDLVEIQDGRFLDIGQLDEVIFGFDEVLDYDVFVDNDNEDMIELHIHIKTKTDHFDVLQRDVKEALRKIPVIQKGITSNKMKFPSISKRDTYMKDGRAKRKIKQHTKEGLSI
ncbi:DVU_1553 family AMP-dependent CoA ligase [Clostridium formicaceticum]|uniref:Phenylacetate-coenzyme A ligase n=1 Tax=Clostridium formicaceticum TaxID=1497 RepID=A0AAC9RH31_9CLOT|nr:AMP-binding protein [Clostridium formicaceticum]AOY76457.1 hypothetical protein BJL90_11390 [Clostridium formicaceticum]ARE86856.1 Phenylacetate-coenzyme A ligase [Clostridium formicaceticum]